MDTYSLLREIADSWILLMMFIFFVGVALWAFLPSQSTAREEASMIPFRDWENENRNGSGTCEENAGNGRSMKMEGLSDG